MDFRIRGLDPAPFRQFYGASEATLRAAGVRRMLANTSPGFPDRVEIRDAAPGETVLLLNYEHQPAETPYRARHAIFVIEGAERPFDGVNSVPATLRSRWISLRAFSDAGDLLDAALIEGEQLEKAIEPLLMRDEVAYLHAHFAKFGCYAARVERA